MSESRVTQPGALRRRVLHPATLISFGAAVLLLVALIRGADISIGEMVEAAGEANVLLVAAALGSYYVNFPLRGIRWRILIRNAQTADGGEPAPLPSAYAFAESVFLGWFVNAISWLRMGDAYRGYLISRQGRGHSYPTLLGSLIGERVIDAISFVVILVLSGAFLWVEASGTALAITGVALLFGGGGIVLIAVFVVFGKQVTGRQPPTVGEWTERLRIGAITSLSGRMPAIVTLSFAAWLAEISRLLLVTWALGMDVPLPVIAFVALAHNLITSIPATPGGLGFAEAGMVALLLPWMPLEEAAVLTALDRSVSWLSVVVLGAMAMGWREGIRRGRF